jgi:sterol desaturase/sphingolipid hydroxylase (fatty acid hydroxylase superfamily)
MRHDLVLHLIPLSAFIVLWVLGVRHPARLHAADDRRARAGLAALFIVVGASVPLLLPAAWLSAHRLIDSSGLPAAMQVLWGWLGWTFVQYWYHRTLHRAPLLWRIHQLHHSARSMDVFVALRFHPMELVAVIALNQFTTLFVLGLDPLAAAAVANLGLVSLTLIHSNIRTPRFMGHWVYRPEAHLLHHQRGVHAGNYCDFPLWDRVFGTFREPDGVYSGDLGFDEDAPIASLLMARNMSSRGGTHRASAIEPR